MKGDLTVGRFTVPFDEALKHTKRYLSAETNQRSAEPYAFPAYDRFDAERNIPDELTDADLLAPVLLNVGISIRSFYGLQRVRDHLGGVLRDVDGLSLAGASDGQISKLVGSAYEILDDHRRPPGIGGVKLSKVLHRKRPEFFVLYDKQVRRCYLGTEAVPQVPRGSRTWAEFMVLLSRAIRDDLEAQEDTWNELLSAAAPDRPVTLVRLLDIVAWKRGSDAGGSAVQADEDE